MTARRDADLDSLLAALDPPAVIVTAAAGRRRAGCLVTFSTQCSTRPSRYLVCLSPANATFEVACAAEHLAVHAVPPDAVGLAALFGGCSGDVTDKLAVASWQPWDDGTPLLDGCGWFVGRIVDRHVLGDHVAMVLEPVAASPAVAPDTLRLGDVRHIRAGHPL